MKERILRMLKTSGGYVSGQDICSELGVSRTAVWKHINSLKEDGYKIEAVKNKGYYLSEMPNLLSESEIKSELSDCKWFGSQVAFFEETDSTNNAAKRLAESGAEHGLLVVAEQQSMGKGRRGRSWVSSKGTGVWMTLLLKPDIKPVNVSGLTLVSAMATAKAINVETGLDAKIKWPNDIVVNGKKVTGILTELSAELDFVNYVIVGTGINVNMEEFPDEIKDKATSLKIQTGREIKRSRIIAEFGRYFEKYYAEYIKTEDMSNLKDEYDSKLINLGREVEVVGGNNSFKGIAKGIDSKGELLVEKEDGSIDSVLAGEVSVRGIYGYI